MARPDQTQIAEAAHVTCRDPVDRARLADGSCRKALSRRAGTHCSWWLLGVLGLVLSGSITSPVHGEDGSRTAMQGLDEQVQEIKSDVLSIAAELSLLEERLLHPSDTQVAVFIAFAEGEAPDLDAVSVEIDGRPVAHHIYSFKELEALNKGGVQRIYTGNIATGDHRLGVSVSGKLPGGEDYSRTEAFDLRKEVGPKLVGITLAKDASGADVQVEGW